MENFWIGFAVGMSIGVAVMWAYFVTMGLIRDKGEWEAHQEKSRNPCDVGEV